ncbi:right-handed parallel beta-helix repeat-containing protein [Burkholderia sp. BCC0398]|uniref:right-handed parallel beta-helix repeat-containing protein n=1 Tax=Burkholderia sp. BCC0398 TaxID=2676297 RepID=UPI00158C7F81|nr:right-handed parallel beta-helix repeat-containing protein [Burkholderia sp. BCC0398]
MTTGAGVRLTGFPPASGFTDTDLVYMSQSGVTVKGTVAQLRAALAANRSVETFVAGTNFTPGTTPSLTLAGSYGSINAIDVYFDGVPQLDCTLSGKTLTFNPVIPAGTQQVVVKGANAGSIGTPSDGTVTDVKVAIGSKLYCRINDEIHITDPAFGAVPGLDASAALQAAINYVLSLPNGGQIYAPAGTWLINAKISIPKNTAKTLRLIGAGGATAFQAGSSLPAGPMFDLGQGSSAAGGVDCVIAGMYVLPGQSISTIGFRCLNMNGIRFEDVQFGALQVGVWMTECYATRFRNCQWIGTKVQAIYSSSPAHNIVLDSCKGYSVGGSTGQFLRIDGATNNIVIQNCDFEQCASVYSLAAGSSSVRVIGCYIEYCVNLEFYHQGLCYSIDVSDNWIALNTGGVLGGPGGGATSTFQNWSGGSFSNNTGYQMSVAWDATASDVDVGHNYNAGSFIVAPAPFAVVTSGSLTNGWSLGAYAVGYKKSSDGKVQLRGAVVAGTLGSPAFTLPQAYWPPQRANFAALTSTGTLASVIVDTNGNVVPNIAGGSPGQTVYLDMISYSAG